MWTGNPVYPFLFSQHGTDPVRLGIWTDYMNGFGLGKNALDYLLLPINIFLHHDRFATFMGTMEMPSPIFLLVILYPFVRTKQSADQKRNLDLLFSVTLALFILWAAGFDAADPLFTAIIPRIEHFMRIHSHIAHQMIKNSRYVRIIIYSAVGGMVIATLLFMGIYVNLVRPDKVLSGVEIQSGFP